MDASRVFATAEVTGPSRVETIQGKEYRVFPATLVRSQVLHNNLGATFLPAEEIEASVEDWNDMPVVLRHPKRRGREVSAREPGILNERGLGRIYRARFEDDALKADVFVDLDRAEEDEEVAGIVQNVDDGEAEELSTGFATHAEEAPETEEFDLILRDIRPDHLALLPGETGACSVNDGCGLGVNEGKPENVVRIDTNVHAFDPSDPTFTEKLREVVSNAISKIAGQQEDEFSLDDQRDALREAIEVEAGGPDTFTWIEELFADDVVYGVEPQGGERQFFRAPYMIDEEERSAEIGEREEVEKTVEFVPVENRWEPRTDWAFAANCGCQETDMTREEMIEALAENEDVGLTAETLEGMDDDEIAAVANLAGLTEEEPETEETEEATEAEPATNETPEWAENLVEQVTEFGDRLEKLEEETAPARNEASEERDRLVQRIVSNSDFSEEELEGQGIAQLQKLDKATKPTDRAFYGLSGPHRRDGREESELSFQVESTLGAGPGDTSRFEN